MKTIPGSSMMACAALAASAWLAPLTAQDTKGDAAAAVAVADSALAAITRGDMTAFSDLMVPEAVSFSARMRDGKSVYRARTRDAERTTPMNVTVTERGWNPDVRVSGLVAMVWYPYDLYLDGKWSHCGVDVFTLVKDAGRWRIATLTYSVVQPPECEKHPKGPPAGVKP